MVYLSAYAKFIRYLTLFIILSLLVIPVTSFQHIQTDTEESTKSSFHIVDMNDPFVSQTSSLARKTERAQGSNYQLGVNAITSPTIEMFSSSSSESFTLTQNETATDDGTLTGKSNNFEFTVTPIISDYDSLDVDVDIYTEEHNFTIEDQNTISLSHSVTYQSIYAQGFGMANLKNNASAFISSVYLDNPIGGSTVNVTIYVFNATQRTSDSVVIPDQNLGSASLVNSDTDNMEFIFNNPIEVKSTQTFVNGTGGYIFLVLQRTDTDGANVMALGYKDDGVGEPNDGPTFYYLNSSGAASPSLTPSDWGAETSYDVTFRFNATYSFDGSQIQGVIKTPENTGGIPLTAGGRFSEDITRISPTNYTVSFNSSKISPEIGFINVSYTKTEMTKALTPLEFSITPNATLVKWQSTFTSSFGASSSTITKYYSIPNYFTLTSITHEGTILSSPADYRIDTGSQNQTVFIDPGAGTFILNLTTPNELRSANIATYVLDSGWISKTSGFMGTLRDSLGNIDVKAGDKVNATVLNTPSLNLIGGTLNSSLRATNGTILPQRNIGAYIDQSVNSVEHAFTADNISFSTYLDPDIPVGTYTFQHVWFNGTAAGAISVEFGVNPVIDQNIISPSISTTILEGTDVTVSVLVHDRSHPDGNWTQASNKLSWDFDTYLLTSQGLYTDGFSYLYTASVPTSKSTYSGIRPSNYTLTSSFTQEHYSQDKVVNLEIFYRGDSSINAPNNVEATNSFDIQFAPLNLTDGGVTLNTSDLQISVNSSYSMVYNSSTGVRTITIDWNNFPLGQNVFQINWTQPQIRRSADQSFQLDNVTVNFVDSALPSVDSPADVTYNETTTSNEIIWTVSDTYPKNLTIYDNNSLPVTGYDSVPWTSGTISLPVDGLLRGTYTYTILIEDEAGNQNSDSVQVNVFDGVRPGVNSPNDLSYNESSTGNTITWIVSDLHPRNYTVYLEDSPFGIYDSLPWTSGSLAVDIDGISKGVWNFTILLEDESGNQRSDTVIVTVFDGTVPVIDHPVDISYNETTTGNKIIWSVSDTNSQNYTVYKDGLPYPSYTNQAWNTGVLEVDIDGLLRGEYNFTLVIEDESGFTNKDTVIVTVFDGTFPSTSSPVDSSYSEGEVGNNITWSVEDAYALNYTIYMNGTAVAGHKNRTWSTGDLILDTDGLSRGVYNFTLVLQDESGHITVDTVIITVLDTSAPVFISTVQNQTFSEGEDIPDLQWIVSDAHPASYTLEINGSLVSTGTWINLITFDVSNLPEGIYNLTLIVTDESGNSSVETIFITVVDTTSPEVNTPADIEYELGSSGYSITWSGNDTHPDDYFIYLNGIIVESGKWNATVRFGVDGLGLGVHNVTIQLFDNSGNSVIDTVLIRVIDTVIPSIFTGAPMELNITSGKSYTLNFTATDLDPGSYFIYINTSVVDTGTWLSGEVIFFSLKNLEVGYYNISVVFTDGSGNTSPTITVLVTVRDPELIYTLLPQFPITSTVRGGDVDEFTVIWRMENGTVVPDANLSAVLIDSDGLEYMSFSISSTNGEFIVRLNYTGIPIGNYTWIFNLTKEGYVHRVISTSIQVEKHVVNVNIQLPSDLTQGENYTIVVHVSYASDTGGILLSGVNSPKGGVPDVNLSVVIQYIANDGSVTTLIKNGITDTSGNAVIVLTGDETALIQSLTSITTSLLSSDFILVGEPSIPASELPAVKQGENDIVDWFVFILSTVIENITLFLAIFGFLLLLITLAFYRIKSAKKRARIIASSAKTAAEEIRGLNSISTIFIRSSSGLPFFEENYKVTNVDIALVSGISTAVNSILSELREDEYGFETMLRSGLSITSHKMRYSTMVIISSDNLPTTILSQIERAHAAVENKYKEKINDSSLINSIDMEDVASIIEGNGLRLSLKRILKVKLNIINSMRSKSSINRLVRTNLDHIAEFHEAIKEADVPLTLPALIEYLDTKVNDRELVYRIIATLVGHNALIGDMKMNSL